MDSGRSPQRMTRHRSVHCSSYLSGWKDRRPWQRNLLPKWNGRNGTDNKETLRDTYRNPDGTHRSSGRMDQSYRIIYDAGPKDLNPYELTHKFKTRCRTFSCALFFCLYFCIIRIVYRRMAWIKNLMTTDRISAL